MSDTQEDSTQLTAHCSRTGHGAEGNKTTATQQIHLSPDYYRGGQWMVPWSTDASAEATASPGSSLLL